MTVDRKAQAARTKLVADAVWLATKTRGNGTQRTRDGHRLVMASEPVMMLSPAGVEIGVRCQVRLYGRDGAELDIDPTVEVVNPPTIVIDADGVETVDPLGALWTALLDHFVGA